MRADHVPAHALWPALTASAGPKVEPAVPAGSLATCRDQAELFRSAALRAALRYRPPDGGAPRTFVENYPLPATLAVAAWRRELADRPAWGDAYIDEIRRALYNGAGMPFHDIHARSSLYLGEHNDTLWKRTFELFDQAGDLNCMLMWAEDGYAIRRELGWENALHESLDSILSRAKRPTDLCDVFAGIVLARPDAAQWLRELAPHVSDSCRVTTHRDGVKSRTAHGFGGLGLEAWINGVTYQSPARFDATPYVPAPWSDEQVAQYDGAPTLALLHRPHFAMFAADAAAPKGLSMDERAAKLQAALQGAINAGLAGKAPQRVFFDTGPLEEEGDKRALLMQSLRAVAPDRQYWDAANGICLSARLGNLGAAASFAGVGLASIAAWETGESALVVNMRRDDGASVLAVSPVSQDYRRTFKRRPYEAT